MKKILLTILDGVGHREEKEGNALKQANTPFFDYLLNKYPYSFLEASGELVGLPKNQMGNSEVGHFNIGAGRTVYQSLQMINQAIEDSSFFSNRKILNFFENSKNKIHVFGLISDGGVHSHINHFLAFLNLAKQNNVKQVYFHLITDGRDTSVDSSYKYIKVLEDEMKKLGLGKISTICGRYYFMDRDKRYERTKKAYDMLVNNVGEDFLCSKDAIEYNYSKNLTDEFIEPSIIENVKISENDSIFVLNFRPDRVIQILKTFTNDFNEFETVKFNNLNILTMMPVTSLEFDYVFKLDELKNTFGEYVSKLNIKQLRIAETEKYPHVTYYFDGGEEKKLLNCDRILVPSPKVKTYDLKPEMSCNEITDELLNRLNNYDVVILNYANGDMVGHTGDINAAIKALETIDYNLKRIYDKCNELGYLLLVTADHGNCEEMVGDKITTHSNNKVYFIACDNKYKLKDGKLGDIAPTMLKIMDIDIPKEMTGKILVETLK